MKSMKENIQYIQDNATNRLEELKEKHRSSTGVGNVELYNADPNCKHDIKAEWNGIKCTKCPGWFSY